MNLDPRHPFARCLWLSLSLSRCAHERGPVVALRVERTEWIAAVHEELAIQHGQRFVLREGRWTPLDSRMASPIVAVSRAGDHWLFASEDGVIARSRGVDGPLERVAELGAHLRAQRSLARPATPDRRWSVVDRRDERSADVLIALRSPPDRSLWLIDAQGSVRALSFAHSVVRARFASARLGAVELEDQRLLCTRDGGARWTEVERSSSAPIDALGLERGSLVVSDGARWTLDERCALAPAGPSAAPPLRARDGDATVLHSAIALREPRSMGAWWSAQSARYWIDRRELVVLDPSSGQRSLYDLGAARCAAIAFGDALLVPCVTGGAEDTLTIRRLDARGARLRPWLSLRGPGADRSLAVDRAGRFVLTAAPCDSRDPTGPSRLCRIEPDGARRALRLQSPIESMIGPWGSLVLAWRASAQGRERFAFDPSTGADVAIPPWLASAQTHLERSAQQTITAVTAEGALWVGDALERVRRAPLGPVGAAVIGAGFIDPSRGVAFGERSDALWVTDDGAASWRPIAPRIDGAPRALRTHSYSDPARRARAIACDEDACAIGDQLVARWPHAREPASGADAALPLSRRTDALAPGERESAPWLQHVIDPYYEGARFCAAPAATREEPAPEEPELRWVLAVGLTLRCRTSAPRWSCAFEGEQTRQYGLREGARFELSMGGDALAPSDRGLRLEAGSDQGVVLQSNTSGRARHVAIGRAMRPWWIEPPAEGALPIERSGVRLGAPWLDSPWWLQGESAWTAYPAERGAARGVVLVEHRADGAAGRSSGFIPSQAIVRGWLAARAGRVGWLVASQVADATLFWAADAREPERLGGLFETPLSPCEPGAIEADTDTVILRELNVRGAIESPLGSSPLVYVRAARSGARACIERALHAPWQTVGQRWGAAVEWRARDGRWTVFSQASAREPIASAPCER